MYFQESTRDGERGGKEKIDEQQIFYIYLYIAVIETMRCFDAIATELNSHYKADKKGGMGSF